MNSFEAKNINIHQISDKEQAQARKWATRYGPTLSFLA